MGSSSKLSLEEPLDEARAMSTPDQYESGPKDRSDSPLVHLPARISHDQEDPPENTSSISPVALDNLADRMRELVLEPKSKQDTGKGGGSAGEEFDQKLVQDCDNALLSQMSSAFESENAQIPQLPPAFGNVLTHDPSSVSSPYEPSNHDYNPNPPAFESTLPLYIAGDALYTPSFPQPKDTSRVCKVNISGQTYYLDEPHFTPTSPRYPPTSPNYTPISPQYEPKYLQYKIKSYYRPRFLPSKPSSPYDPRPKYPQITADNRRSQWFQDMEIEKHKYERMNLAVFLKGQAKKTESQSPPNSPLLKINFDVRSLILEYVLTSCSRIKAIHDRNDLYPAVPPSNYEGRVFHDLINVSLTCWQLHNEAKRIFYQQNTFLIGHGVNEYLNFNHLGCLSRGRLHMAALFMEEVHAEDLTEPPHARKFALDFISTSDYGPECSGVFEKLDGFGFVVKLFEERRFNKPEVWDLVLKIPHSFKLCDHHFDIQSQIYDNISDAASHQNGVLCCWGTPLWMESDNTDHPEPFSKGREKIYDLYFEDIERLLKSLKDLTSLDYRFLWETFHPAADLHGDVKSSAGSSELCRRSCHWYVLHSLLELHKRFDHSDKREGRMAWLRGLGGTDASGLR